MPRPQDYLELVMPKLTSNVRLALDTAHRAHAKSAPAEAPKSKPIAIPKPRLALGAKAAAGIAESTLRLSWGW